jgi:ATP-dependent DNA helicase RecQ
MGRSRRGNAARVSRRDDLEAAARRLFGWEELRAEQLTAMQAVLGGRDVLAILPTGAGKSAIYQVPATLLDGVTVVVSPLIALQSDQIVALHGSGARDAVAVNSRQGVRQNRKSWEALRSGTAGYLFLAPEQLLNDDVLAQLERLDVSLFVVDEAHCVSAWGHDFRPSYLRLSDALNRLGPHRPPVVALTATASPTVRDDILAQLRLDDPQIVTASFDRPNIRLEVHRHLDDDAKTRAAVDVAADRTGPGLVYTATRRQAVDTAEALAERGIRAAAYHAGLKAAQRDEVHRAFRGGDVDVVVATSAFGMGIDKADVRFVVHASIPDSLDSYYQQIGRAGRDGEPAAAVLFYRSEDLGLARFFSSASADVDQLRAVLGALSGRTPRRLRDLRERSGVRGRALTRAVNLLEQAAAVTSDRRGLLSRTDDVEAAVQRAVATTEAAQRVDETRVEMMRRYAEAQTCRRKHLLAYFGQVSDEACGNCDVCEERSVRDDPEPQDDAAMAPGTAVTHDAWGRGVVIEGESDRVTVLFDEAGYRTLALSVLERSDILSPVEPAV